MMKTVNLVLAGAVKKSDVFRHRAGVKKKTIGSGNCPYLLYPFWPIESPKNYKSIQMTKQKLSND